jgi:hypothetical protein
MALLMCRIVVVLFLGCGPVLTCAVVAFTCGGWSTSDRGVVFAGLVLHGWFLRGSQPRLCGAVCGQGVAGCSGSLGVVGLLLSDAGALICWMLVCGNLVYVRTRRTAPALLVEPVVDGNLFGGNGVVGVASLWCCRVGDTRMTSPGF